MYTNPITGLNTIMFVETEHEQGRMIVGYHLNNHNYQYAPQGKIRIARFTTSFCPLQNHGYYGDVYLNIILRKWKRCKQRQREKLTLHLVTNRRNWPYDITHHIVAFL